MAIQMRRGANADFDKSKMLAGELAVTTDGTRKVYAAFGANDAKELASKEDVQGLIDGFASVVDREIAEAEQRIESKAETVLGTIPDDYETVSQKADEAVRTKADAIVCTVSGVNPIAKDSSNDYLRNLKLYGKTTQVTTTGKNLFDYETHKANGYTSTINVIGGKTLYRNGQVSEMSRYTLYDSNGDSLGTFLDFDFTKNNPLILPDNASYIIVTDIGDEYISTLYIGYDSDTTFEKYTGLQPSPSPQYKQDLVSKGKWGNLAQYEALNHSGNNAVIPESLKDVKQITMAVKPNAGTQAINYQITFENGQYEYDSIVTANADNNKWYTKTRTFSSWNVKAVKIYSVEDASYTARTVEHMFVGVGTWNIDDNSYRPYSGQREIESGVYGKNLLDINNVSILSTTANEFLVNLPKGTYTFSCENENSKRVRVNYTDGTYTDVLPWSTSKTCTFTIEKAVKGVQVNSGTDIDLTTWKCQLEIGTVATEYEPYKAKQSHISLVGDGLKGIPVTDASLATYTDENGQMWCSDYVDCERGVLVQRIGSYTFDGTEDFVDETAENLLVLNPITKGQLSYLSMSNRFIMANSYSDLVNTSKTAGLSSTRFMVKKDTFATADELKAFLRDNETTIFFALAEPIETPLSASEIASFKALHSNYKVTTVMNDCECYESITYNADTETWINNKIEARVASVLASLAL